MIPHRHTLLHDGSTMTLHYKVEREREDERNQAAFLFPFGPSRNFIIPSSVVTTSNNRARLAGLLHAPHMPLTRPFHSENRDIY